MLARDNRLTASIEFSHTVRSGGRAGTRLLVLHWMAADDQLEQPRIGFVVSKQVGGAVVRNRVRRRLRHLLRSRLKALPAGRLVVRANAASCGASFSMLGADLDRCLTRLGLPAAPAAPPATGVAQ